MLTIAEGSFVGARKILSDVMKTWKEGIRRSFALGTGLEFCLILV